MAARIVNDHHMSLRQQLQRSVFDHAHDLIMNSAIGGYHVEISGTDAHVAHAQSRFRQRPVRRQPSAVASFPQSDPLFT
jgi:hypothetical protein